MRRDGRELLTVLLVVVVAVPVLIVASALFIASKSLSPPGPQIGPGGPPTSGGTGVEFSGPNQSWAGHGIWYNFTVVGVTTTLTWGLVRATIVPGLFEGTDANWTLSVTDTPRLTIATFQPPVSPTGNWTTDSVEPVVSGDVVVLLVDSPLTEGGFSLSWGGSSPGSYGSGPLP